MISVLLAAHCGEKYIAEQIASILPQLRRNELLVSDDSPEGHTRTRDIVQSFSDQRIRYMQGPRQGVIKNFEFLLTQAKGDILVLCDQDDVWLPGKLKDARNLLSQPYPALLVHGAVVTDEALQKTGETQCARLGLLPNLIKNSYTGCCMAFTRELLPYILPFPENIPMHDQWIGLRTELLMHKKEGVVCLFETPFILHRRHGDTQTGQGSTIGQKIRWRWNIIKALYRRGA